MMLTKYFESEFAKHERMYFWSKASYNRKSDTIILWRAKTPTGRISKYWATLRINGERQITKEKMIDVIKNYKLPKLKKGYAWSEPMLYCGDF